MSNVRIYEDEEFAEPALTSLICSSKAPTQLRSVTALDLMSSGQNLDEDGLNIEIFFKIKHTFAALLSYVSRNFGLLHAERDIRLVPKEHLAIVLKHKLLCVACEDEVLNAIALWGTPLLITRFRGCLLYTSPSPRDS